MAERALVGLSRWTGALALALLLPACGVADLVDLGGSDKVNLPPGASMAGTESSAARGVLVRINGERTRAGLVPLLWDAIAADAAYDHAVDMRTRGYYAHMSPEGEGPCTRLRRAGVETFACGAETIARGDDTADEVVDTWLASPAHREVLFNPVATHVGIGVSMGGGGPWWVLDLFSPAFD